MRNRLTPTTVRLHPETIKTIDQLLKRQDKIFPANHFSRHTSEMTRSDLLRIAINTGLDVLTAEPALKL